MGRGQRLCSRTLSHQCRSGLASHFRIGGQLKAKSFASTLHSSSWQSRANMQHASTCINMHQHVSTCISMYQHVSACINMYQHVSRCGYICQHVSICCYMYQHVPTCTVSSCRAVSWEWGDFRRSSFVCSIANACAGMSLLLGIPAP